MYIGEEAKQKLLETLTADVEFLTKLHLMDYSLLLGKKSNTIVLFKSFVKLPILGIHEVERGELEMQRERENEAENTGVESDDSENGSGLDNRNFGFNTPPDSPNAIAQFIRDQSLQYEGNCNFC